MKKTVLGGVARSPAQRRLGCGTASVSGVLFPLTMGGPGSKTTAEAQPCLGLVESNFRSASGFAGLTMWRSKPASIALALSLLCAVAAQCYQCGRLQLGALPHRPSYFVAVHAGHTDIEEHEFGQEADAVLMASAPL